MKCVTAIISILEHRYRAKSIQNMLVFPCCIPTHLQCFVTLNSSKTKKYDDIINRFDTYIRFFCTNQ